MPATLTDLRTLDALLDAAGAGYRAARAAADHSPNGRNIAAKEEAQALVDRLLDARLTGMR
jgi:hypothetical protein